MTAQLLREILDSVRDEIDTLGMNEVMTEGEDAPNPVERAAIERVEGMLQSCADALLGEIEALERRQLDPQSAANGGLIEDNADFDKEQHTEDEIAQHNAGLAAGLAGQPNDGTKSAVRQRGWADAQE
ncbi:MAG: hypothetical protein JWQ49_6409 [Edaphobacter sp.]|nr:hypothetical protein [Edaphobacter sp.]